MRSSIISWFASLIILSFTFCNISQARNLKKPNYVIVGTVYCDSCIQEDFSKARHFISGALVVVECENESSKPTFRQEAETNENGNFKVRLAIFVAKHVKNIKGCSVKLLESSKPFCAVASSSNSYTFRLESRKQDTRVFSTGLSTFKSSNQLEICSKTPKKELKSKKRKLAQSSQDLNFPPPIRDPDVPLIPPIPDLPKIPTLPNLPPLPPLPKSPILPLKTSKISKDVVIRKDTKSKNIIPQIPIATSRPTLGFPFPPNPLQPPSIFLPNPLQPPSIFPPNPFQPPSIFPPNPLQPPSIFPPIPNPFTPPPSIFPPIPNPFTPPPSIFPPIPNPFTPPPSIFPPITFPPLIPGLVSSPPPPVFPIPFPPNPFQPPPSIFPPINFPPLVPGLIPSPPPPPPPVFPIPLPPGFPGFPPSSKKTSP